MNLPYIISRQIFRVVFSAVFQIRVHGREHIPPEGPLLLLSNHQSFLDPVLCGVALDRELNYMARDSLFRNRLFGRYIRTLNAFPVQRGKADLRAIKEIIRLLRSGRAVAMFPEATRTADGRIRTIKSGFELIARRSGATTVPVVIDGAFDAWPRHRPLPWMADIHVQYGEPITPQQMAEMGPEMFVIEINRRMRTMQRELRLRCGKKPFNYD